MQTAVRRRGNATIATVATAALALGGLAFNQTAAQAAEASITIADPGAVEAGPVELRGAVSAGSPSQTTSVLYVMDASRSTMDSPGSDCNGDGTADDGDDINGDKRVKTDGTIVGVGDILDCEIAAVRSLNAGLAASGTGNLQVGLVAFADEAKAANLSPPPAAPATFLPPGGATPAQLDTVLRSVRRAPEADQRASIGAYTPEDLGLSGSGTAFNSAVEKALDTLGAAAAGPQWVMFLTDGAAPVSDDSLGRLSASPDVKWRSFGVGAGADCGQFGALFKLANATGEACTVVTDPARTASNVTGAQPDNINGVTLKVGDVTVAADVDAIGGWRATLNIGAGSYNAAATATLTSGRTVSASRSFSVAARTTPLPPGTPAPPPPGGVAPAPGSGTLLATQVLVERPKPLRKALPKSVSGEVGLAGKELDKTKRLNGAKVLLQGRGAAGQTWKTVGTATVKKGAYEVSWDRKKAIRNLRVSLASHSGLAASVAEVPVAKIRACDVDKGKRRWSMTCVTTAKKGTRAKLFEDGDRVDRAKVRKHTVSVEAKGRPAGHKLVLYTKKGKVKLTL